MTRIKVRYSFLVFNALLFLMRDGNLIAAFYISCIAHEFGHILALKLTGGELRSVELGCSGIKMTASPCKNIREGIAVLMCGPAVNLLIFAVFRILGIRGYICAFNLAEGIFNLLPFRFLDGGAALELLAEGSVHEIFIRRIITAVRIVAAAILTVLICEFFVNFF